MTEGLILVMPLVFLLGLWLGMVSAAHRMRDLLKWHRSLETAARRLALVDALTDPTRYQLRLGQLQDELDRQRAGRAS